MGKGNASDGAVCLLLAFLNLTKAFLNNFLFISLIKEFKLKAREFKEKKN